MGLMISPESLILHGHLTALSGILFIAPLLLAGMLHWINTGDKGPTDESTLLIKAYGRLTAGLLMLLARPTATVCLATAMLVTAGFVFNETFVYWFPNFGFAFLLLAFITVINTIDKRVAAIAQIIFTGTAVIGLLSLDLVALWSWAAPSTEPVVADWNSAPRSIALAVLAFIGYDLLAYTPVNEQSTRNQRPMRIGLLATGALFIVWNLATWHFVAAERLNDTHIPHLLTAKAVAGQSGRVIIGIVTLAGTCAAVNLLFQSTARMLVRMGQQKLIPQIAGHANAQLRLSVVGLAALTGMLMAGGFAGTEFLDIAIRAGLIYWIVLYASLQLARLRQHPKRAKHLLVATAMSATSIALILQPDAIEELLITLAIIFLLSFSITVFSVRRAGKATLSATPPIQERR